MRAALALLLLLAQSTASFDAVSIKPADAKAEVPIIGTYVEGNRWLASHATVRDIIRDAHESEGFDMPDRVVGGPAWLDNDLFDIVATSPSRPSRALREKMLQAMLADRFRVTEHLERKTLAAYELVLARSDGALGRQLRRTTTGCSPECSVSLIFGPSRWMTSNSVEMARFAFVLSTVLQRPIIDRTGLSGHFAVSLEFAPATDLTAADPSPDAPSIFTAVEEQLGLKLRSIKAPIDVLVVDRAEKPTPD